MSEKLKLIVFGSGRGSNFKAILDNILAGTVHAEVVAVITNNKDAGMISIAESMLPHVPVFIIENKDLTREIHEASILDKLDSLDYDLIILAGYMRVLSPNFINTVELSGKKILNIHPSLLPAFPGLHAQRQALEYGVKYSGCTVHLVNAVVDGGKILGQRVVDVFVNDTEDSLSQRILQQEHQLYSEIINKIALNEIII